MGRQGEIHKSFDELSDAGKSAPPQEDAPGPVPRRPLPRPRQRLLPRGSGPGEDTGRGFRACSIRTTGSPTAPWWMGSARYRTRRLSARVPLRTGEVEPDQKESEFFCNETANRFFCLRDADHGGRQARGIRPGRRRKRRTLKPLRNSGRSCTGRRRDWHYTDAQGKKWIYRKTPFGVSRMEDKPDTRPAVQAVRPGGCKGHRETERTFCSSVPALSAPRSGGRRRPN